MLPVSITPYYMSLVSRDDRSQPLRRTVIPTTAEFDRGPGEADDPLGEDGDSPVPGLVHRYPDRVLLLVTDFCSSYCRYCTRSRMVGHGGIAPSEARLEQAFDYIRRTPSDPRRADLRRRPAGPERRAAGLDPRPACGRFRTWSSCGMGTKMPAVLPQRITPELCRMLRKHHPLWMSLHFLHPDECTPESFLACTRLADAGIPLGSQTVLLAGVNDNVETMKNLVHRLLMMRVRPYYLYQCDPISGSAHFRTPGLQGPGDHRGAPRPHDRLCGAQLRDRRPRRRRQDPLAAQLRRRPRRRRPAAAQLPRRRVSAIPIRYEPGGDGRGNCFA